MSFTMARTKPLLALNDFAHAFKLFPVLFGRFHFHMMKLRSRGTNLESGFCDNGYYRKMYSNPNWRDTTDERDIDNAAHPFVSTGMIKIKRFSALQKAITYCILRNGGSCGAGYIVKFLDDHVTYINSDRPKPLDRKPDLRILHINTAVRKDGMEIFKRDPRNSSNFMCNAPKGFKAGNTVIPTGRKRSIAGSELPPEKAQHKHKEATEQKEDKLKETAKEKPPATFDEKLLEVMKKEPVPMSLAEITEKANGFIGDKGPFMELTAERRVRANLIVLKSRKQITFLPETGQWCVEGLKSNCKSNENESAADSKAPLTTEIKISNLTISELYAIVKSKHDS